jgi:uncharacterized membrane protein YagU involved in acid resistance
VSILANALKGSISGVIAAVPMTLAMNRMHRELPLEDQEPLPPRQITEELAERAKVDHHLGEDGMRTAAYVNHFGYGAAAGAAYGLVARGTPMAPLVSGTLFAIAVWAVSYFGWLPAMKILPPAHEHSARGNAIMVLAHLIWGSVMGLSFALLTRRRHG